MQRKVYLLQTIHPHNKSHLCLDIHQNHFGLNLPSYCCLGPLPKPKRPHFVWCVGCLRQRPAFCFLDEDFSSFFLHFSVSSLEIPFGKQVFNSYLHYLTNSSFTLNCTKTLFPFWGIKHQRSQCSVGAFRTTKSPLPTYFTFLLQLRLKKTFKKSCISFLNLWSMKRQFPAHSDKLIFNCRHL